MVQHALRKGGRADQSFFGIKDMEKTVMTDIRRALFQLIMKPADVALKIRFKGNDIVPIVFSLCGFPERQ